ncbi:MAG: mobile mystery protein B [Candidatus Rokuibacteriota bacterium]
MTDDPSGESGQDRATPLSPEDRADLIPKHITLRRELNEAEAAGVRDAVLWALGRRRTLSTILGSGFIRSLHKRMLGGVWAWAGSYRVRDTNIGVPPHEIPVELRKLQGDVTYWVSHGTFPPDEIAIRFHHRLVLIHPFPNGNGRVSRLMGDLVAISLGQDRFSWGADSLKENARPQYLEAVRAADEGDFEALVALARVP